MGWSDYSNLKAFSTKSINGVFVFFLHEILRMQLLFEKQEIMEKQCIDGLQARVK